MKNKYSLSIVAAVVLTVSFFSSTPFASAQTSSAPTVICPVGYVCTSPSSSGGGGGGHKVPVSDAVVTVKGTPVITLSSSGGKESTLTALFNISIDGKTSGISIYPKAGAYGQFLNTTTNNPFSAYGIFAVPALTPTIHDENGELLVVVKPGQVLTFQVLMTANPQSMIAGAYKGSLLVLRAAPYTTGNTIQSSDGFKLVVPKNETASKVIVGELSPYITSISPQGPLTPGKVVTLTGTKLTGTKLLIDGVMQSIPLTITATSVKFTLPSLTPGYHYFSLYRTTTGASNDFQFEVVGLVNRAVKLNALPFPVSTPSVLGYTYELSYDSARVAPTSVDLTLSCAVGVSGAFSKTEGKDKEMCGGMEKMEKGVDGLYRLNVTFTNSTTSSRIVNATAHANPGTDAASYDRNQIILPGNRDACPKGYVCSTDATASVISQNLELIYDTSQKEVQLKSAYTVAVNGGSEGVYIYKAGGGQVFVDQGGNRSQANSQSSQGLTPITVVSTKTDSYGQTLFVVPAGRTIHFSGMTTVDPRQMFAGTYYASVISVWANRNTTDITNSFNIEVADNKSNTKTIIGETSPYISVVTSPIKIGDKFSVNGQSLHKSTDFGAVYIDGTRLQGTIVDGTKDGSTLFFVLPQMAPGSHSLYVTTEAGMSNYAYFYIDGDTNTQRSIKVSSPNNETWVTGMRKVISWTSTNISSEAEVYISLVREGTTDYFDISSVYDRAKNTGMYVWEVGKNAEGVSMDKDGSYWVRVCTVGNTVCNAGDGKVAMLTPPPVVVNKPPVISSVTGPTALKTGEMGTWTIGAYDPEGRSLSYSVLWGDEGTKGVASPRVAPQSSNFYHSYGVAGVYTPTFTVKDSEGASVSSSKSVTVTAVSTTVSEKITCTFTGSTATQECDGNYVKGIAGVVPFYCTGVSSCEVNVSATKGTQLVWKSTCAETQQPVTTIDGVNESVSFPCVSQIAPAVTVVSNSAGIVTRQYPNDQLDVSFKVKIDNTQDKVLTLQKNPLIACGLCVYFHPFSFDLIRDGQIVFQAGQPSATGSPQLSASYSVASFTIPAKSSIELIYTVNLHMRSILGSVAGKYQIKLKDLITTDGSISIGGVNMSSATYVSVPTTDTIPPSLLSIATPSQEITSSSARITWTTNEPATDYVEYGITQAYGKVYSNSNLSTSHSVTLNSLSPNTLYYYRVTSRDAVGNSTSAPNGKMFTTLVSSTPTPTPSVSASATPMPTTPTPTYTPTPTPSSSSNPYPTSSYYPTYTPTPSYTPSSSPTPSGSPSAAVSSTSWVAALLNSFGQLFAR